MSSTESENLIYKLGLGIRQPSHFRNKSFSEDERAFGKNSAYMNKQKAKAAVLDELDKLDANAEAYIRAYKKKRAKLWFAFDELSDKPLEAFKEAKP